MVNKSGFGLIIIVIAITILVMVSAVAYTQYTPSVPTNLPSIAQKNFVVPSKSPVNVSTDNSQAKEPVVITGYVMQNNTGCTLGTGGECYLTLNGKQGITTAVYCNSDDSKTGLNINTGEQVEVEGVEVSEGKYSSCLGGSIRKL